MNDQSFTTTLTVDQSPAAVFAAVNDVRGWWSGQIDGKTDALGAEFTYRYRDFHYTKQRIAEMVPDRRVAWDVTDSHLAIANETEWTGTRVVFEIAPVGDKTELRFTHAGLVPACECYDMCARGWTFYIESLRKLITTGKGEPAQGI